MHHAGNNATYYLDLFTLLETYSCMCSRYQEFRNRGNNASLVDHKIGVAKRWIDNEWREFMRRSSMSPVAETMTHERDIE
jgi:hypothetical protein